MLCLLLKPLDLTIEKSLKGTLSRIFIVKELGYFGHGNIKFQPVTIKTK